MKEMPVPAPDSPIVAASDEIPNWHFLDSITKRGRDTRLAVSMRVALSGDTEGCCLFHMSNTAGCSGVILLCEQPPHSPW